MDNSSLKTHSSSGYFVISALSFSFVTIVAYKPNNLLIGKTPTLYVGKGIGRNPGIFIEKYIFDIFVLYSLAYNKIMTCSHIWPILSIIFFHCVQITIFISVGRGLNLNFSICSIENWNYNNIYCISNKCR